MNANTILAFRGGTARNRMVALVGDLATAAVPAAIATDTVGTTAQALLAVPLQTARLGSANPLSINANGAILGPAYGRLFGSPRGVNAPYFNSASFDGVPFRVRVSGVATMGAVALQSLTISLVHGNGVLIGAVGNSTIATTGALAAVAGGAMDFSLVAELLWDSSLQFLSGRYSSVINFVTPTTAVKSDVVLDAQPAAASLATLRFQVYATAAVLNSSTVQFNEFSLEAI